MSAADPRTTYQLAPALVTLLEQLARAWGVRPGEALERAVRTSAERLAASHPLDARSDATTAERPEAVDDRVALLRELQAAAALDPDAAARWADAVREERYAGTRPPTD